MSVTSTTNAFALPALSVVVPLPELPPQPAASARRTKAATNRVFMAVSLRTSGGRANVWSVGATPCPLPGCAPGRPQRRRVGDQPVVLGGPAAVHRLLVVGCIHGNEPAGNAIVRRLVQAGAPAGTEIVAVTSI